MSFEFITDVEISYTTTGVMVGHITKNPEWTNPTPTAYAPKPRRKFSMVDAIAVRAENVADLMGWLDECDYNVTRGHGSKRKARDWDDFYTLNDWPTCLDTMQNHPYKLNKFDRNDTPIKNVDTVGTEVHYDVSGDYIDMGRLLSGEPECWGYTTMGNPKGLFATIVISTGAPAYVDAAIMRLRGARIMRLVDWLETQGIRTEILAISANECGYLECVVKKHEDSINMDTLAVVSCPDFHRRIVFRMRELSQTWEVGYGYTRFFRDNVMSLPPIKGRGMLIISENYSSEWACNRGFDVLEKEIETMIAEGDTTFTKLV